jgi:hypothetical protein
MALRAGRVDAALATSQTRPEKMRFELSLLGRLTSWAWTFIAGGGGLWLLFTRGPWPPTNGWFALFSGLAACPLTGWVLKKYVGTSISGWFQFGVALFFFVSGRVALTIWPHS